MIFERDGFELIDNFITAAQITSVTQELADINVAGGGLRNADKKLATVAELVASEKFLSAATQYLPSKANFVRAIVFAKSTENNWFVNWHQDRTIAVSKSFSSPGWGPWSTKDGVLHVQPPVDVLKQMVTFRIHLDQATTNNGCLRLIANSHTQGLIPQALIPGYVEKNSIVECEAPKGAALVMRPHVLHSSSKARSPQPRRILHIEYSSYPLPNGAEWV